MLLAATTLLTGVTASLAQSRRGGPPSPSYSSNQLPSSADFFVKPRQPDGRPSEKWLQAGMRRLEGVYLDLYTDLAPSPAVEELPQVFDAAVQQWGRYFALPAERLRGWKLQGFLIGDKQRFQQLGLPPPNLPNFQNGYQRGQQLWLYEQSSDYYRRHLLLHEGVHGFMSGLLHGGGPPWYVEGMAELLATHRWQNQHLELAIMPAEREQTPLWGRIKIIRDGYDQRRARSLLDVMNYSERAHLEVEPYGWCWGAAYFLDHYQPTQTLFRTFRAQPRESTSDFNRRLYAVLRPQWARLCLQWQLFVAEVDYGYDLEREQIQYQPVVELAAEGAIVNVSAEHGWQSSGLQLKKGASYQLTAQGRFQLADQPRIWWSEPGGVTIRYHRGRPAGMLLAAVHNATQPPQGLTQLARPWAIGLGASITPASDGVLFLKINESPALWRDNQGQVQVAVHPSTSDSRPASAERRP